MFLFLLSFILLVITSYFITSLLKPVNFISGFIYFLIVSFAQIVLIAEILSPFKTLYPASFFVLQIIIAILTCFAWFRFDKPIFKHSPICTFKRILKCILSDKALLILSFGFIFFICVSLFLSLIMVLRSGDAAVYHAARSLFWAQNHSINHFFTPQVRMLSFPINSEILYTWVILFTKNIYGLCLFSFIGFILSIAALFGIMDRYSIPRRLWVIFIVSSFSSVLVQASGTETDVIIAGLVLSSMYLFKQGVRQQNKLPVFMSALCYALALGTKTTAFFLIPAVGVFMIYFAHKYLQKAWYKPFLFFLGYGIINFLIFSAYNYIENIIWFSNPLGAPNTIELHKNYYGLRGAVANFIKNSVLLFDFTGFTWNEAVGKYLIPMRDSLLQLLNLADIPDGRNSGNSEILNKTILAPLMGEGVLGIIVFIPSLLFALVYPLFKRNSITVENFLYSIMFLLTLFIMSYSIMFMTYNNRFIASFLMVCAPLIGYSYFKKFKIGKWIIVFFAMFYLTLVSTHQWHQPAGKIFNALFVKHIPLKEVQARERWALYKKNTDIPVLETEIKKVIYSYPKETRFVIFPSFFAYFAILAQLKNEGYNVDIRVLETFDINELNNYDVVIYNKNDQLSNIAYNYNNYKEYNSNSPINCIYFSKDNKTITPLSGINPTNSHCVLNGKYLYNAGYQPNNIVLYSAKPGYKNENQIEYLFLKKQAKT